MTDIPGRQVRADRGVAPVLAVVLLVALVILIGITVALGAFMLLPEDGTTQPNVDFIVDRTNGRIVLDARYMTAGTPLALLLNGQQVHAWVGGNTTADQRLQCLERGDRVAVGANLEGDRSYLVERFTVERPTACPYNASRRNLSASIVADYSPAIFDDDYEFTLAIDPDGPGSEGGVMSADNPWHHIRRYDRPVENLDPPVYVVVFADNADWDSTPPADAGADAYYVDANGNLHLTTDNVEPTDDIFLLFQPGCTSSTVQFVAEDAGYSNQILLGDTVVINNTNNVGSGYTTSAPGVTCVG